MNPDAVETAPWRTIVVGTVLVGLTVLTLSRVGSRRPLAASFGKWLAAAAGLAIGPAGLGLVGEHELATIRPLGGILLTWVGLIVGLQLTRATMQRVPAVLGRWSAADTIVGVLAGAATVAILRLRLGSDPWTANSLMAAILVATACLGWSPETRSLGLGISREGQTLATLVRAGAGLQAVIATLAFGIAATVTDFGPDGILRFEGWWGFALLATATAISVLVAIGSWMLLERIATRPGERLVLALGTLAVLAGTAEWLHTTPLLTGLICGAVLANLGGAGLASLSARLKDAELMVAIAVFLLAGLLLGPVDLALLAALTGTCLVVRLALKPALTATVGLPGGMSGRILRLAVGRPAPLATAIVAGGVLLRDSQLRRTVLAAILLTGFVVFLMHLVRRPPGRSPRREGGAA